jgi:hypothetical protein
MFPLRFPFDVLKGARVGDWVLDPFCGRGTTLFAARLHGLPSVGVDSNPVAVAVAASKLATPKISSVIAKAEEILGAKHRVEVPTGRFWELCFHPQTLSDICKLRHGLLSRCVSDAEVTLRALILGILHGPRQKGSPTYLSNQMPRTYSTKPASAIRYWERHGLLKPPRVNVIDAIVKRARFSLAKLPPPTPGLVWLADSRQMNFSPHNGVRFSWVVTSPPYFGMRTYRSDQWLRNWFLGGPPSVDYSQGGQISHHLNGFVEELRQVWANVASACVTGAKLVVRFGCLPSSPIDPEELIFQSLKLSGRKWRILAVCDAGSAGSGKRQASQFGRAKEPAKHEVDILAVLED